MAVVVHLFQFIYTWTSKDPDVIFTLAVLTHEMEISGCSPIWDQTPEVSHSFKMFQDFCDRHQVAWDSMGKGSEAPSKWPPPSYELVYKPHELPFGNLT